MNDLKSPLVSICIPVFNGELYIERALISCISQSYNNIEIIIIDNNSNDLTCSLIKRIKNICRLTTNFQIGVFHYYKRMDIIFKDIFYRSKIWTEFYIKGKVIKDKRFSSFSVITKLIPLMFLISIFFYKINVIPIFLCIISYLVFNLNLFLFILNKTNIKILIFSVIFYFIFLLFATLGLIAGLSTQIVKILYSKFKFLNQNEYNNYKT